LGAKIHRRTAQAQSADDHIGLSAADRRHRELRHIERIEGDAPGERCRRCGEIVLATQADRPGLQHHGQGVVQHVIDGRRAQLRDGEAPLRGERLQPEPTVPAQPFTRL